MFRMQLFSKTRKSQAEMKKLYGSIDTMATSTGTLQDHVVSGEAEKEEINNHFIIPADDECTSLTNSENSPYPFGNSKPAPICNRYLSCPVYWILYYTIIIYFLTWFAMSFCSVHISFSGSHTKEDEYDYIIIGAGPAGLVAGVNLANRLEQEAQASNSTPRKVLVLESGTKSQSAVMEQLNNPYLTQESEPPLNKFDVPLMWSSLSQKDSGDKGLSEYLSHHWPVEILGRAVGGSGLHNAMINVRALPNDFDRWNVSNWGAEDVLPYYNRLESYDESPPIPKLWENDPIRNERGSHGPLNTLLGTGTVSPIADKIISSSIAAGIPRASLGFNEADAERRIGIGYYEFNIRNGIRDSAAKAVLSPHLQNIGVPKNLIIRTDATVDKVLFDSCGNDSICEPESVGVRYFESKTSTFKEVMLSNVNQRKKRRTPEIILSAGAILTPQILANSGIHKNGPVVDSDKVGTNLQDHPVIGVVFRANKETAETLASYFNIGEGSKALKTYLQNYHRSMRREVHSKRRINEVIDKNFTTNKYSMPPHPKVYGTAGFNVGGFLRSPYEEKVSALGPSRSGAPDIQLTFFPHTIEPHFTQQHNSSNASGIHSILVTVTLLRPDARYHLKLHQSAEKSNNPKPQPSTREPPPLRTQFENMFQFHVPDIEGGTLSDRDKKRLAWGVNQVRTIFSSSPLSETITAEQYPGTKYLGLQLENFIGQHIMRNSHWSGSTRMGNDDDDGAVVDSELRVKGVKGLRIIDAGVMPFIPNGNTHSTTCAIALRGVDLILG